MSAIEEGKLDRRQLSELQQRRLAELIHHILPRNQFYAEKFAAANIEFGSTIAIDDLHRLPFTTKTELLDNQAAHPPYGTNLTESIENYTRYHQTSGTSGQPLRWPDTTDSWQSVLNCWHKIFQIVGVQPSDRLFFPFSFGPFLGFWSAFEAACQLGCLCMPGGGMTSAARLKFLLDNQATVVLCTPTYALHLAQIAQEQQLDLQCSSVRMLIVAGEPGGSIEAIRSRIERSWGARLIDHSGLTEIGPLTVECLAAPGGLHVLEGDYLVEVVDPVTGQSVAPGNTGEMVVTTMRRMACPLVRYRTGDLVRVDSQPCPCGLNYLRLDGGILGRCDDLIHVRGNNVYPSALEAVLRRFDEIVEYRIEVDETGSLTALRIEVETKENADGAMIAQQATQAIRDTLFFRPEIRPVPPGSLPRFELKARRFVRKK